MKKKLVSLLAMILTVVMICPTMVFAEEPFAISESSYTIYTNSTKNTVDLDVPAEYTNVGWGSNKPGVATVDSNGVVRAVAKGEAVITATNHSNNEQTASCTITVVERAISGTVTIKTEPTNKNYVSGQYFDPSGMKVEIPWNDGTVEASNITLKENTPLRAGQTEVVVSADGIDVTVTGLTVSERTVSSVEVIDAVKTYTVGEYISGINLKVTWNDATEDVLTKGFDVSINRALTIADNNATVTVSYGGKSATFTIKVKEQETETTPSTPSEPSTTVTRTATKTNSLTKTSYKVGETLKFDGITVTLSDNGTPVKTLYANELNSSVTYTFTSSDIGTNKTFYVNISYLSNTYRLTLTGITVTADTDDSKLRSISEFELEDDEYPVGTVFDLDDIEELKAVFYDDDASRNSDTYTETLDQSELNGYEFFDSDDMRLEVLTSSGARKSSSNSAYRDTILDSDVKEDDDGNKEVTVRLYYERYTNYNSSSTTETYVDLTIDVGESDIAYYYENTLIAIYEDLEDALEYCLEDDDAWDDFELSNVDDDEEVTLKLGKDYRIDSGFEDFTPEKCNIIIDLNGHDLRFYSDTIVIDEDDEDRTVTITNSSKTEAQFEYYDESITITLGEDDKFVFEYDEDADDDYLPGVVTVTATAGTGGRISAAPTLSSSGTVQVGMGSDIKFTITPEKDYAVDTVKVNSRTVATTNNSAYSVSSTGVVTYTLEDVEVNTKVEVTFKETKKKWDNPFTDVRESSSYYSAVEFVYTHELFKGTTDTKFAPNTTMTRAMFVTVLGRLADVDVSDYRTSSFTDVPLNSTTSWYAPYVQWAVDYGIVEGYGDGTFGPNNEITHQQMYVMMYRYSMFVENNSINVRNVSLSNISDRVDIADWATDAVKYAQQNDFLVLSGNRVDPTGDALRWELATLLESFCETVLNWAE